MTTYLSQTQTCCLCGTEVECSVVGSTTSNGSPDLDLRPAAMERETMHTWFQQCPSCHYVSVDLGRESDNARAIVESAAYRALIADDQLPATARRFACCALLNAQDREIAATALLRAAWDCDDQGAEDLARSFRQQSADILMKLQPFEDSEEQATLGTMLIDVLRRAARFEEAERVARQLLKFKAVKRSRVMLAVVQFQQSLCESRSTLCRQVEDALQD